MDSTAAESLDNLSHFSRCGQDLGTGSGSPAPASSQLPACHRPSGESAPLRIEVEHWPPTWIADEKCGKECHVCLHEYFVRAGGDHMRDVTWRVAMSRDRGNTG